MYGAPFSLHKRDLMITSCGLVIKSENKILVCHPYGRTGDAVWDIPKGIKFQDESDLETAYREAKEEVGLNLIDCDGDVSFIGRFKYYGKPKELVAFLLEADKDLTKISLQCMSFIDDGPLKGKPEHDGFKWVGIEQAIKMTHKTVSKVLQKVAEYS